MVGRRKKRITFVFDVLFFFFEMKTFRWFCFFIQDDVERDLTYLPACRKLKEDLKSVENLQIEILKLLLTPSDVLQNPPSSKYLFITNFRGFLKENLTESPVRFDFFINRSENVEKLSDQNSYRLKSTRFFFADPQLSTGNYSKFLSSFVTSSRILLDSVSPSEIIRWRWRIFVTIWKCFCSKSQIYR